MLLLCCAIIAQSQIDLTVKPTVKPVTIVKNDKLKGPCRLDRDCNDGRYCEAGICIIPIYDPCKYVRCPADKYCKGGFCVQNANPCANVNCLRDEHCEQGKCISNYDPCRYVNCKSPNYCVNGICNYGNPTTCELNSDCRPPKECVARKCK